MIPPPPRMNFEEACRWNEEMLELFPPKPNRAELNASTKCHVAFVL